jgi:hypothetical protein
MVSRRPEYESVLIEVQKPGLKQSATGVPIERPSLIPETAEVAERTSPEKETTNPLMTWNIRSIEIDPEQWGRCQKIWQIRYHISGDAACSRDLTHLAKFEGGRPDGLKRERKFFTVAIPCRYPSSFCDVIL